LNVSIISSKLQRHLSGLAQKVSAVEDDIVVLSLELTAERDDRLTPDANLPDVPGQVIARKFRICQFLRHIAATEVIVHHLHRGLSCETAVGHCQFMLKYYVD